MTLTTKLPCLEHLPPTTDQSALGRRGFFYAGGDYVDSPAGRIMTGQMFVEVLVPKAPRQPYPLVMIHGGGQSATNFLQTPDGRPGWADYFVQQGYVVYLVDQPARARSPWHPAVNGPQRFVSVAAAEQRFSASRPSDEWPQADLHTQWPGEGREGDPAFDGFFAGQIPSLASEVETQTLIQKAGAALLDRIGPAILLTHSQSGPHSLVIADARPQHVAALVMVEPSGPPVNAMIVGVGEERPYGLTAIPLTYEPPVRGPADLVFVEQERSERPGLAAGILQAPPVRKLANLSQIPVLVVTGEASYHAPYDHCTVAYLVQAGVPVDFVRLEERGIRGNGHMMMLEKNNLVIAALLHNWIESRLAGECRPARS
jgi:pimeloyl-ACP methyl ester carboxylesterase